MERLLSQTPRASLTEREAKQVVALYGVPVVSDALVSSSAAARETAASR